MKRFYYFFLFMTCLILSLKPLHAQWKSYGGPFGAPSHAFAVSGEILYAGAVNDAHYRTPLTQIEYTNNGSVYCSLDKGRSWTQLNTGLANTDVSALAVLGGDLFAGTHEGMYVSHDKGVSWAASGMVNSFIEDLVVTDGKIFAATFDGIFCSRDNGVTWSQAGLPAIRIYDIQVAGTTLYVGTDHGIYKSTNGGTVWVKTAMPAGDFYSVAVVGNTIYGGTIAGGILRLADGSSAWTVVHNSGTLGTVNNLEVFGNDIYAASFGGIFHIANNDTSGTLADSGITFTGYTDSPMPIVSSLGVVGTDIYAWPFRGGIYRSSNGGTNWENQGIPSPLVISFAVTGTHVFAATLDGVYRSADHGITWTAVNNGLTHMNWGGNQSSSVEVLAASGSNLFAGTQLGGVFLSTDEGASWNAVNVGLPVGFNFTVRALAVSGSTIYAATTSGVYRSVNNGASWTAINNGLLSKNEILSLAVSGTDLYAGMWGDTSIYRSTDNGETWKAASIGLPLTAVCALGARGTELFAGCGYGSTGVARSTDKGATWNASNTGLTSTYISSLAFSESYICAGSINGAFFSDDDGATWKNIGLTNTKIKAVVIDGPNIIAGTYGNGVWVRPLSEVRTSSVTRSDERPVNFSLNQNYPNPFNPLTTISFSIPAKEYVSLKIIDVMGRDVATIVSDDLTAGTYQHQWNASGIPSGVYFYRLQAGAYAETKRLVLLK